MTEVDRELADRMIATFRNRDLPMAERRKAMGWLLRAGFGVQLPRAKDDSDA